MKAVLIGSRAYKDTGQDIDLICDQEYADQLSGCEVKDSPYGKNYYVHGTFEATVPNPGTAYELLLDSENLKNGYAELDLTCFGIKERKLKKASIPALLALKKAHLILPIKWQHHVREYGVLKNLLGVEVFNPKDHGVHSLYKLHRKEVKQRAKAHPRLNQDKDNFFEEAIFKIFDHDTIHQAVAVGDKPAYTYMLDGEVWCSREKWSQMSEEQKLNCVVEESAILALERSIIPALYLGSSYRGAEWAYKFALFKVCTTITSGWFRDYCIEHYDAAVKARPDFVAAFFKGVKSGLVKVLKPEVVYGAD